MQYKTTEEVDHESALATQESLVELGRILQEKEQRMQAFEKIYQSLEDEYKDLLEFDIQNINANFNLNSYLTENITSNQFHLNHDKYKLFILNEMTKYKYQLLDEKKNELIQSIDEMNEQSDEYLDQIDGLEKSHLEEKNKLALRITKLREKCIYKNKVIFWQEVGLFFLGYVAVISPFRVYSQLNLILSFLFAIFSFTFGSIYSVIYSILSFLMYYNILPMILGALMGSVGLFLFYKYKYKKEEVKQIKAKDHLE
ncbi:hypothetical protein CPAV1605_1429 [seawater metagenome]|uniref:Uncharacterized protein n=1 Tax=seawater metagenome TaxID=1561972 RepID=A0A5E8CL99_9ZZZZ